MSEKVPAVVWGVRTLGWFVSSAAKLSTLIAIKINCHGWKVYFDCLWRARDEGKVVPHRTCGSATNNCYRNHHCLMGFICSSV